MPRPTLPGQTVPQDAAFCDIHGRDLCPTGAWHNPRGETALACVFRKRRKYQALEADRTEGPVGLRCGRWQPADGLRPKTETRQDSGPGSFCGVPDYLPWPTRGYLAARLEPFPAGSPYTMSGSRRWTAYHVRKSPQSEAAHGGSVCTAGSRGGKHLQLCGDPATGFQFRNRRAGLGHRRGRG